MFMVATTLSSPATVARSTGPAAALDAEAEAPRRASLIEKTECDRDEAAFMP